ncbi:hypothetical protein Tco_0329409 [Tanacetum coccineum]
MVSSPHGFIIHWIVISKNIKKVTEVVDVKNWRVDKFSGVVVDYFFDRMELFCFVGEVFDSEYVRVQGMVECSALADLGASINLMPLFGGKIISLPETYFLLE